VHISSFGSDDHIGTIPRSFESNGLANSSTRSGNEERTSSQLPKMNA